MLKSCYIFCWSGLIIIGLFQRAETVYTSCGGQLTQEAGQIWSPNFPNVYPNDAICSWVITVQPGKIIDFTFLSFDLEDSSHERYSLNGHCTDYVALHNGPSRQDAIISGDICDPKSERQYRSRGNKMLVYFYSDSTASTRGFSASYKAIDCKPFTYGRDVCDKNCTCKQENTMYCNSVNNTCACKTGWTSSDCSVDINECLKPYSCSDLYSSCVNTNGSHECPCKHGMILNNGSCEDQKQCKTKKCSHACSVESSMETCYCPKGMRLDPKDNLTCRECDDWKFGDNCQFDCTCYKSRTQSCDKVEGLCSCYLNWTSTDCSENVNECALEKPPCDTTHSVCVDTVGWFECRCFQGYEKVANETTCQECGRILTEANDTIVSRAYINDYRPYYDMISPIDCNWTIQVNESNIISLQFTRYNYEYSPGYCQLEIYDGGNIHAKLIYTIDVLNGYPYDLIVRSSSNQMHIVRRSSGYSGSFNAIYWSHECPEFMWGPQCTTNCSCVESNTEYCDNINGNCVCKKAWKSTDCSVDANECSDDPLACPDYSDCTNLVGSYNCTCKDGLVNSQAGCTRDPNIGHCSQKNCSHVCAHTTVQGQTTEKCYCPIGMILDKDQCVACKNLTYGPDCRDICKCIPNNTVSCDTATGYCECLNTWTGPYCSKDIDECNLRIDKCRQPMSLCYNTPGGHRCICQEGNGYEESANGTCIPIDCSHTLTNASGIIESPNFPQNYFNNANCSWKITVAAGDVVSLRFLFSDLEYTSKCSWDYIDVYDGQDQTARLIGRYCYSYPELLRSTRNNMFINFISNTYNVFGGFNASYTSHPCPDFTYGNVSCDKNCSCNKEHTQFCDSTNGVCICTSGWVGRDCATDLNECLDTQSNICPHNSDCINTVGSYKCQCHLGFALNSSTNVCDYNPNCKVKNCSHTCYIRGSGEEQCACPDDLVLDQAEGLYCVVPYFPYGAISNDDQLSPSTIVQNVTASAPVQFGSGVPFGMSMKLTANVHFNGLISFDDGRIAAMGTPDLKLALDIKLEVIATYWANTNPTKGRVFHKLYQKCEPSMFLESPLGKTSSNKTDVMRRIERDISMFYNLPGFEVDTALVVTWEKLRPYGISSGALQENTFQAVYVSGWTKETKDGQTTLWDEESSYVIFLYQHGQMNWEHIPGRPISIGNTGLNFQDLSRTDTATIPMLDKIPGNTGQNGVWTYKVGNSIGSEQKCHKYVCTHADLVSDSRYQDELNRLYKCPCTLERLGRQWQLYEKRGANQDIYCYAISALAKHRLLSGNLRNKLCCYRWNKPACGDWQAWERTWREAAYLPKSPDSGHVLINDLWSYDPFDNFQARENIQAHQWCCRNSNNADLCNRFYKIFPDMGCSNFVDFVPASALGDPHITTLDGKTYTMNGWGEYIMMEVLSENFTLQARTERAETAGGTLTNATVFTAFAAKESNYTHFQVQLAWTNTTMVIIANGADLTNGFYNDFDFSFSNDAIIVARECRSNKTAVVATFPCGISIKVSVGVKSLEIELEVNSNLAGKTRGLLGNFNKNINDEFSLPDGTILASNLSEREIYQKFAKAWAVTKDTSVFIYDQGESAANYQHPNFVPMFIDEADPTQLKNAQAVCGDSNDACIFDFIVTNDMLFAQNTKLVKTQQENTVQNLDNSPPTLVVKNETFSNGRWVVEQGKEAVLQVVAIDADKDQVSIHIVGDSLVGVTVADNGTITYISDVNVAITLTIQAKDSKGGYSPVVFIPISTCSGCSGNGHCDVTGAVRKVTYKNDFYQILACICDPAYTGNDCESELDGCAVLPCSVGQNCTDLPAKEQGKSPVGYKCGPCPEGFRDFDGKCTDVNECNGTNHCEQICVNTEGSYFCLCNDGYRLNDTDRRTCIDVNECEERIAACQQECSNTEGAYVCSCRGDYKLNTDGKSCKLDSSYTDKCRHCEQVCTVNNSVATCSCHVGYTQDKQNSSKCIDVDECQTDNMPCSQVCTNTIGWYKCECHDGYKLDADGISCSACTAPYYGNKCGNICNCRGRGTCDPVRGCVCFHQWTGTNCEHDVDECKNPEACPAGQVCRNEEGSYTCECPSGYQMENGVCKDIDECVGPQAVLRCNSTENCVNNEGNYSCECKQGYAKDWQSHCIDINECTSGVNMCEQICENVPGLFNCKCHFGYKLAEDRRACRKDRDVCGQHLNCSHGCSIDLDKQLYFCYCPLGYSLVNNITCEDINECARNDLNLCSFKSGCVNTNGSYSCSCKNGYKLDNDGRTCVACTGGTWGKDCANSCACGAGADHCDPAIGCVCRSGFTGKQCTDDINECDNGQKICKVGEKCVNLPGTAICECQDGYNKASGQCEDIDECSNTTTNNCSQMCINIDGGFTCTCYPGYIFDTTTNTCSDINECDFPASASHCEQICQNTQGSYRCSCRQGLRLKSDGITCDALTTCSASPCSDLCAFMNNQPTCFCPKGKKLNSDGKTCDDVDLCANSHCKFGCVETLRNTSFECVCPPGTQLATDGVTCIDCIPGKWGLKCANNCSCVASNIEKCDKVSGSCSCKKGWTGRNCDSDINECRPTSGTVCPAFSLCLNTPGGYVCACQPGYVQKNGSREICEECDNNYYGESCLKRCQCGTNFECDKVNGSCYCLPQWTGKNCDTDIDECQDGIQHCDSLKHEMCVNTYGGYRCECQHGRWRKCDSCDCKECEQWKFGHNCSEVCQCNTSTTNSCNKTAGTCSCRSGWTGKSCTEDVNECLSTAVCPVHSDCQNMPGTHKCICHVGYTLNSSNICQECEQWKFGQNCSEVCQCNTSTTNSCNKTAGTCSCRSGWTGKTCTEDVNECLSTAVCPDHSDCQNVPGTHKCVCHVGYTLNSSNICQECEQWKFGQNCSEVCQCNTNTTSLCSKTDGTCSCRSGWTGKSCTVDVNECLSTAVCPDHSDCQNMPGTHKCVCHVGYTLNSLKNICEECEQWKFGQNCSEVCQCNTSTTSSCNRVDGTCSCKTGWVGTSCSVNQNKCQSGLVVCPDHSDCQNGPETCVCHVGYTMDGAKTICQECDQWKFGHNCSEVCQCNSNTTSSCNKADGTCSCRTGWTGKSCTEDVNECLSTAVCPDHSDCQNVPGTYKCVCNVGYIMDATNQICRECGPWKFGQECSSDCQCNKNSSSSCKNTNGICDCTSGWTGIDCSEPIEWATVAMTATLDYDVTLVDLKNENSESYRNLRIGLENQMTYKLSIELKVEVIVNIVAMRKGSLIVDSQTRFPKNEVKDPEKDVTKAALKMMDKGLTINNDNVSFKEMAVAQKQFMAGESKCLQKERYDPCEGGCEEQGDEAVCKPVKDKNTDFTLGISLGVSLFVLLCIVIGVGTYCWQRKQPKITKQEQRAEVTEQNRNSDYELQMVAMKFSTDRGDSRYSPFSTSREQDIDRRTSARSQYDRPETSRHHSTRESTYEQTGIPRVRRVV